MLRPTVCVYFSVTPAVTPLRGQRLADPVMPHRGQRRLNYRSHDAVSWTADGRFRDAARTVDGGFEDPVMPHRGQRRLTDPMMPHHGRRRFTDSVMPHHGRWMADSVMPHHGRYVAVYRFRDAALWTADGRFRDAAHRGRRI